MMFGHVDRPDHWLTHLRVLAEVQDHAAAGELVGDSPSSCPCPSSTTPHRCTWRALDALALHTTSPGWSTLRLGYCCTAASTTSRSRGSSSAPRGRGSCSGPEPTTSAARSWRRRISRMAGSAPRLGNNGRPRWPAGPADVGRPAGNGPPLTVRSAKKDQNGRSRTGGCAA